MARSQLASLNDVREYWDSHPLLSHELADVGSPAFCEALDRIKRTDAERISLAYWGFDAFARKRVLDVGCGPGCRDVIRGGRDGMMVPQVDSDVLAGTMERLLDGGSLRHDYAARAAEFDGDSVVGRDVALYERLAGEAAR